MARIILKGISGCLRGEVFLFEEKGVCIVGRTDDCNIKISREQDIAVSRRHCMLIIDPPTIKVRDLFSTNGTYVDDERLIPKIIEGSSEYDESCDRELKHGDRVSIGGMVFIVEISSELNPEENMGYSHGIYTTKTTKTRLIPFERATTRSGSLIPQEKLPPSPKIEEEEPSETQRLLSMPITEPIPREKFLSSVKQKTKSPFASNGTINKEKTEDQESKRKVIHIVDSKNVIHVEDPVSEAQTNIIDWKNEEKSKTTTKEEVAELETLPTYETVPDAEQKIPDNSEEIISNEKIQTAQDEPIIPPPPPEPEIPDQIEDSEIPKEQKFLNDDDDEPHIIGELHQDHHSEEEKIEDSEASDKSRGMPGWYHTDLS